jgi:hypothetical protein
MGPRPSIGSRRTSSIYADLGQRLVLGPQRCGIHVPDDDTCRVPLPHQGGYVSDLASSRSSRPRPRQIDWVDQMDVEHIKWFRETGPRVRFESRYPPTACCQVKALYRHRMSCSDSESEEVLLGVEVAVIEHVRHHSGRSVSELLHTKDVWIGGRDHSTEIVGVGSVDEQIDGHDTNEGHEAKRLLGSVGR